ncbi:MAG: FtsQ-type POTRA domain-containing protein, partial [Candidatus Hydrogenedentes bacterium]|nr:FtsQ-type POTRA domain-containing protein [Candidatus Hydrogenedentota bacterium]
MSAGAIRGKRVRSRVRTSKRKQFSMHRIEMWAALIFLLMIGGFIFWKIIDPASLLVKDTLFEGLHILSADEVRDAAGVTTADNIFLLDMAAIKKRVENIPYVKRCRITRMYPGKVSFRIVERKAVATVMLNNHIFEIDNEKVVLRELDCKATPIEPLITNLPGITAVPPGSQIDSEVLKQALKLWDECKELSFAQTITLSEISAVHPNDLRMYFNELPYEIRWGRSDFGTQARRFEVLWNEMEGSIPCEYYLDLRFGM